MPQKVPVILVMIAVLMSLVMSCGKTSTAPDTRAENLFRQGHNLLGAWRTMIDLDDRSIDIIPMRESSKHYDVTKFLMPPFCSDCFQISLQGIDWDNLEVTADVTVKNFTAALSGYDVRGIVYPLGDYTLKNPHAYTLLFAPAEVDTPAGFRAYKTTDPDRILAPGESDTETYVIGFPEGAGFVDLVYAIDASWPDHCPEPYDIFGFSQEPLDLLPGSTAEISVHVADWQNNTSKVTINTDIFGGSEAELTHVSGDLWSGTITNVYGIPLGLYPVLLTGRDQGTLNHLFQWVDVYVTDLSDTEPPVWDSDVGITGLAAGLTGVLVKFGTATDINDPVTYNLYYSLTTPIDFGTATVITGIENSPYLLEGLTGGEYFFCLRAEDIIGNETVNTEETSAIVGIHPNVYWQDGPNMPTPRGNAGGFIYDGTFWVLGGSATGTLFDKVEWYDPDTEVWNNPWNLPDTRDSFACEEIDGVVYIFGGRDAVPNTTPTCYSIDLSDGNNVHLPDLPVSLSDHGSAKIGNTIYMTGGQTWTGSGYEYHKESYSFSPSATEYTGETDMEFENFRFGMAAGQDYLMTCGGGDGIANTMYHTPGTKSWNWKADMPFGRSGNNAEIVDGWLYSMGGEAAWMAMTNVAVMDIEGDTWYEIEPLTHMRYSATSATDGAYIYIAGGFINVGPAYIPLASFEIGKIF